MKVICIGNYPPRKCGIATFTENLVKSIVEVSNVHSDHLDIEVIAMNESGETYDYPSIVKRYINDKNKEEYISTADYINNSGADICLLQHEYGIYGGESGLLILALLRRLKVPIITTFHTVLQKPSFHQKEVLQKIAAYSSKVVIMNGLAVDFLKDSFGIDPNKVLRIQHGVPDFSHFEASPDLVPESWKNKKIILTFGLIGRSKGIDTVIRALPEIVKIFPDILYVVLGKTHPHIIQHAGEEYRDYLKSLSKTLHVDNHVMFIDEYVSEKDLMNYLSLADIYVTPYQNKAQITSGTLSYAVASGCAVVSTPYWHAVELLSEKRGMLFDFNNSEELSECIIDLLKNPIKLKDYQEKAFSYGKSITWSSVGASYISLFNQVKSENKLTKTEICSSLPEPRFDLTHLRRLTDKTGVLQHAKAGTPYFKAGYCLDDNTRALILCLMDYHETQDDSVLELINIYTSNILFMQREDGNFDNLLGYDRVKTTDSFSEDALGRAFWALGTLINLAPNDSLFQLGWDMFGRAEQYINGIRYARGIANTIFGIEQIIKRFPDQEKFRMILQSLADQLVSLFHQNQSEGWEWFEKTLSYDNALIPASLYVAYFINYEKKYLEIAEKSRRFLESKCFKEDWLSLIGNERWPGKNDEFYLYAQQPLDAFAMALMYSKMLQFNKSKTVANKLVFSLYWFLGYNDLNLSLIDQETKGCHDGIQEFNINRNQGAESMVSYLLTYKLAAPYLHNLRF